MPFLFFMVAAPFLVLLHSLTYFYFITNILFGHRTFLSSFNLCEAVFHGSEDENLESVWSLQPPYSGSFCIILPGQLTPLFFPFFLLLIFCLSLLHRVDGLSCETAPLPSFLGIGRFYSVLMRSWTNTHAHTHTHAHVQPCRERQALCVHISVGCRCPVWP